MVDRVKQRSIRRWWVRAALAALVPGAAVAAISFGRQPAPSTPATQSAPGVQAATPVAPPADSDYTTRPVAFLGHDTVITREELGEFLIYRRGPLKVDPLVNRRIIEIACRDAGVEVTAGEVEASFAEDLKGFGGITPNDFVKQVLRRYGKNLTEWKEDVVRPKLMLGKLCKSRVRVSDEDLSAAFEARYGEKVECRIIQWPKTAAEAAKAAYPNLRDSEQAFSDLAKRQEMSALASAGGKVKPLNHHLAEFNPPFGDKEVNDRIEREAFRLQPGEVSGILEIPDGLIVIKCDRRVPADTTINPAAVRADLAKEMTEKRTLQEIPKLFNELRDRAKPVSALKDTPALPPAYTPGVSKGRVVAYIHGNVPVTREELGEFLITRYGAEYLDLMVNRRIIEDECKAKGVTIDSSEMEIAWQAKAAASGGPAAFRQMLIANHTLPYQYKEDVLRTQLQLAKLSAGRVKVTDDDLKAAYEAYYGEKVECRLIMWPKDERKFAMAEYAGLRDSEEKFCEKCSKQANPGTGEKPRPPDERRKRAAHRPAHPGQRGSGAGAVQPAARRGEQAGRDARGDRRDEVRQAPAARRVGVAGVGARPARQGGRGAQVAN
jgi:hypothetical protein